MERALGWRPTWFRLATADRGASETAARWVVADREVAVRGRRSAFVKIGATDLTAEWTRTEHRNYRALAGWFLPEVLGFDDDGERPALALEDLSGAAWPPPRTPDRVALVLAGLVAIRGTRPANPFQRHSSDPVADWASVAADAEPFLALGLCSRAWLTAALPVLIAWAGAAPLDGDALVHLDIRSDTSAFATDA